MIGFSFYLDQTFDNESLQYFKSMKNYGFSEVFTSVHIHEKDSQKYLQTFDKLLKAIQNLNLKLIIDIDKPSLHILHNKLDNLDLILRLDDSFSYDDIVSLSKQTIIALNAGTIDDHDINELKKLDIDFHTLEAWYSQYPHPETGLDLTWIAQKNRWLRKLGFKTQAFVTGNEPYRTPLMAGSPTLERHRNISPFIAAVELDKLNTDGVVIGDPYLELELRKSFDDYFINGYIPLHISNIKIGTPSYLFTKVFHNRKDPARDAIRLTESREMNHRHIGPTNNIERVFGSVTIDNRNYGAYMGEIQIVCRRLPANQNVNVLGTIIESDLKLLSYIDAGSAFKIIRAHS
ncbi:MupG family TIM beta-alpha barrel fold protein [Companilactobacillus jidongensis]|uniref:MupG family TIM beta-alpha barrel fold protein n=1 Tax=Companilactobacillus jidongensis TaxID=2486006 RepID=UPI000F7A0866|nr:MupG family TIM beta-alpha barrel fold protein [Companilactobacillus jidongensis]